MAALVAGLLGQLLARSKLPAYKRAAKPRVKFAKVAKHQPFRTKHRFNNRALLKVRNDGSGNQQASSKKGVPVKKLPNKMQSKIRESLNPVDTASFVTTGSSFTSHGECEYTCEDTVIGGTQEINNVLENARNVFESSAQQGKSGKFYMKSYQMDMKLINSTNGVANLRVYEYICRADVPTNVGTVESILTNGWALQASPPSLPPAPVPSYITKNWVGGSLYQNVGFTPFFRIVKDFKVQLAPGKEFRLSLKNNKSKFLNPISSNPQHVTCLDGYTRGYIIQHMGQPIGDASDPQVLTTSVSKIIWTITKKYNYQQIFDNAGATYELTPAIPTSLPTGHLINQASGVLVNEVVA